MEGRKGESSILGDTPFSFSLPAERDYKMRQSNGITCMDMRKHFKSTPRVLKDDVPRIFSPPPNFLSFFLLYPISYILSSFSFLFLSLFLPFLSPFSLFFYLFLAVLSNFLFLRRQCTRVHFFFSPLRFHRSRSHE